MPKALPVVVGALLIGGAIAGVLLIRPAPRDTDVVTPAIKHVQAQYAKQGHHYTHEQLEAKILSRTDTEAFLGVATPQRFHHLRLTSTNASPWTVAADLEDDFEEWLKKNDVINTAPQRIYKRVGERGGGGPVANFASQSLVKWEPVGLVGFLNTEFTDGGAPCMFSENFLYKNATWHRDGEGRLLQAPPRPPPRRK